VPANGDLGVSNGDDGTDHRGVDEMFRLLGSGAFRHGHHGDLGDHGDSGDSGED